MKNLIKVIKFVERAFLFIKHKFCLHRIIVCRPYEKGWGDVEYIQGDGFCAICGRETTVIQVREECHPNYIGFRHKKQ